MGDPMMVVVGTEVEGQPETRIVARPLPVPVGSDANVVSVTKIRQGRIESVEVHYEVGLHVTISDEG